MNLPKSLHERLANEYVEKRKNQIIKNYSVEIDPMEDYFNAHLSCYLSASEGEYGKGITKINLDRKIFLIGCSIGCNLEWIDFIRNHPDYAGVWHEDKLDVDVTNLVATITQKKSKGEDIVVVINTHPMLKADDAILTEAMAPFESNGKEDQGILDKLQDNPEYGHVPIVVVCFDPALVNDDIECPPNYRNKFNTSRIPESSKYHLMRIPPRADQDQFCKDSVNLISIVQRCVDEIINERNERILDNYTGSMIGKSQPFLKLLEQIEKISLNDFSVVILGASGVGKELVAKSIHDKSKRAKKPFIPINCGAISHTMIDSELFGHKRGAFTDAKADRKGYFEEANGGTIFLDEIGDLPLEQQGKLLRVLEAKKIKPLGVSKEIDNDVRVIAATNRDLRAMVAKGTFREDLWYRLDSGTINVPTLNERTEDIPLLAKRFLDVCNNETERKIVFDKRAFLPLQKKHWDGNIRELKNVVTKLVTKCGRDLEVITADMVKEIIPDEPLDYAKMEIGSFVPTRVLEQEHTKRVFEKTDKNITRTAEILDIDPKTVREKLKDSKNDNPS